MKERPILYSAPMVRAKQAGTKTQTRRVLKLPKHVDQYHSDVQPEWFSPERGVRVVHWPADDAVIELIKCPYGQPGDRLWGREYHALEQLDGDGERVIYHADRAARWKSGGAQFYMASDYRPESRWRASFHMPRWASRILDEIVSVRVERLQDISEADAQAEGVERHLGGWFPYGIRTFMTTFDESGKEVPAQYCIAARDSYRMLWEHINGAGSWDANPWVWVVETRPS